LIAHNKYSSNLNSREKKVGKIQNNNVTQQQQQQQQQQLNLNKSGKNDR
jgi:hypothetical protein